MTTIKRIARFFTEYPWLIDQLNINIYMLTLPWTKYRRTMRFQIVRVMSMSHEVYVKRVRAGAARSPQRKAERAARRQARSFMIEELGGRKLRTARIAALEKEIVLREQDARAEKVLSMTKKELKAHLKQLHLRAIGEADAERDAVQFAHELRLLRQVRKEFAIKEQELKKLFLPTFCPSPAMPLRQPDP